MVNTLFQIVDLILFLCIGLSGTYLFVFAAAFMFKRKERYPQAKNKHRYLVLTPANVVLSQQNYPSDLYSVTSYDSLLQKVKETDELQFDAIVVLGAHTHVSPNLLSDINDVYDAGVIAIQLHHVIKNRSNRKLHRQALAEEIRNSIFKYGHTLLGASSLFEKTDIVVDLQWIKRNLKSEKTNIESRLLRQDKYIAYLNHAYVYSDSARRCESTLTRKKVITKLPKNLLQGNWRYADKLFRQLLPSWSVLLATSAVWCVVSSWYDWSESLKWWLLLFVLLFTISMAIPDYLIKSKKRKNPNNKQV